jgi:hypothetical protein
MAGKRPRRATAKVVVFILTDCKKASVYKKAGGEEEEDEDAGTRQCKGVEFL